MLLQQGRPTVFKGRQLCTGDVRGEQIFGSCSQPRLGRRRSRIEFPQPLTPPGQLYGGKRRLCRSRDHIAHRSIDPPQGFNSRTNLERNETEHKHAIATDRRV